MTKVKIKQFKNKKKEPVAGLTPEHAIYDKNGVRLDAKLGNINLQEFRNLQQHCVNNIKAQEEQSKQNIIAILGDKTLIFNDDHTVSWK